MSQLTARDIRDRLAQQVEAVAEHLLGRSGKRDGHELRYGSTSGEAGKSLAVHLTGERAGVWSDFATGEAGDLLDLWAASRHCDMSTALAEAKEFLGLRDVRIEVVRPAAAKVLARPDGLRPLGVSLTHWLREERKLSPEAIAAYKLVQCSDALAFPFLNPDGTLGAMKFRAVPKDEYWAQKDGAKMLFGWQAIPPTARTVVLCEGELKAMAWWDYGYPALSIPFGGGDGAKQDWIEGEYDRLARFDTIYLAMDADPAGRKAQDFIMQRIGPDRCAVVTLPLPAEPGAKCINACLRHGVSRAAIETAIKAARPRDPVELRSASCYTDELAASFAYTGPEIGLRTPWRKIGDELIFRPGELTVIAGYSGHGKSMAVGFMACHAMSVGLRLCVASLEFKVQSWLKRLLCQLSARHDITAQYVISMVGWLGGRLWAFDAQGTANLDRMLDVFRYARRRYGVTLFVVDNLTGLGIGEEDYQGQKQAALDLSNFARDEDVHVWLVHHIRKASSEDATPNKLDIKGSGAITDLASNVLIVWRNKRKEDALAEAEAKNEAPDDELLDKPDCRIACKKQRNYSGQGSGEPSIRLWWAPGCFHYLGNRKHTPRAFVTLDNPQSSDDVPI